jgi:pimeloyl-ACP methyl ester carboxylesterase
MEALNRRARTGQLRLVLLALLLVLATVISTGSVSAAAPAVLTGSLNGAAYKIEVPANWNGTLVLYSHGYVQPNAENPARDAGDPVTGAWLLGQGYALAGSSYRTTGWAVEQALQDQVALLDFFQQQVGPPKRTIAWGHSLGGMITAGLVQQHPDRFAGALPMCGVLGGGVGIWNGALDAAFVFKTLLAPGSSLQLARITNPNANLQLAQQTLAAAQGTPQGRARLALMAAMADTPGWFDPTSPEPARQDFAAQEQNQLQWAQRITIPFSFALRAELEARARGNPSWNTDVNYREQLARSVDRDEVQALYREAGLDLEEDLRALDSAPRVAADPASVDYLARNIVFDGQLAVPALTMHTTGDGYVPVEQEQAYAATVRAAGKEPLLRQVFVQRAGHCTFTPAETIAAFRALVARLDTGAWDGATNAQALNAAAAGLGADFNVLFVGANRVPTAPAFLEYQPPAFLRPFDARSPRPAVAAPLPGLPNTGAGGKAQGGASPRAPLDVLDLVTVLGGSAELALRRRAAGPPAHRSRNRGRASRGPPPVPSR